LSWKYIHTFSGFDYWGYDNAVLVYDIAERRWGTIEASSTDAELLGAKGECGPFPFNVCLPQVSLFGDKIVVLGGESDNRWVGGHMYGHDSDLAVLGTISDDVSRS